jgi:hypothetical protein
MSDVLSVTQTSQTELADDKAVHETVYPAFRSGSRWLSFCLCKQMEFAFYYSNLFWDHRHIIQPVMIVFM